MKRLPTLTAVAAAAGRALAKSASSITGRTMRHRALRAFLATLPAIVLSACMSTQQQPVEPPAPRVDPEVAARYDSVPGEKHHVPPVAPEDLDPRNVRQLVDYHGPEAPGTLVIDTRQRFLFLVRENGTAMRYGIGVGKEGLEFKGTANVQRKAEWPRWTPTPDMIRREPEKIALGLAACPAAPTTPSARGRYTCSAMARTRFTAYTGPMSRTRLARPYPQAVSACSTRMSSTCTAACRSEPGWWSNSAHHL